MKHRVLSILTASSLAAVCITSVATPFPFFYNSWTARYPASMTDDLLISAGSTGCQVCHQNPSGGAPWNAYGFRVRMGWIATGDIDMAMAMAETFDSDSDVTGSSNLDEITSSTQPGWVPGNDNTVFYADGTPVTNQAAPDCDGDYDPSPINTRYCSPANVNSTGSPGVVGAFGSAEVAQNNLTLTASDLPPAQFGYFLAGRTQGMVIPPNSSGVLCITGNIGRLNAPALIIQGPSGSAPVDLTAIPVNPTSPVLPGESWNFQCWYRDLGNTSNFTDAIEITFN